MHVIAKPNLQGTACNVQQHALFLPAYYSGSLPNTIYYGLGREIGSACDTIFTATSPPLLPALKLYPNPAKAELVLEIANFQRHLSCTFYTLLGQQIHTQMLTQAVTQISVGNWEKGAYFYEIINGKERSYGKVFVE